MRWNLTQPVSAPSPLYRRHRFPPTIISHAVYLYFRFTLSYRDVEELLAVRGIRVSYETIRRWCLKFGPTFAAEVRRRRPHPRDRWHLDEMYLRIAGRTFYLWRAVDADGLVLDIVLQARRNQEAAEVFLRRLVEGQPGEPQVLVTDKLANYVPAIKTVFPRAEHRRRTPTSPRASVSGRDAALSRPRTPNDSWSRSGLSTIISARGATWDEIMCAAA